ncbi:hypothetical protein GCM10011504_17290 [Siccirubricoccus deserti]|uniref:ChaN family lipoprotein n=1 Tax=Siccirubricoccus deserti TaxID=2013562 RepID=A0A9X0R008_9PROT|nr:ChaN family lipoprotein [Siccirubricoccus deserti]GGC39384.1 hypothetical protein GCM10011504_17290 [Siccirubricoccus deserti]
MGAGLGFPPKIYLPLFHFCRQQKVPMVAPNCHRPLVTRVGHDGWAAVPEAEREAAPTPGHRAHIASLSNQRPEGVTDHFLRAQQVWDRAFACNIARVSRAAETAGEPPPLVVGIIGRPSGIRPWHAAPAARPRHRRCGGAAADRGGGT